MVSFPNAFLFFSVGGFNLIKIRIGLSIQNIYLTEAISFGPDLYRFYLVDSSF